MLTKLSVFIIEYSKVKYCYDSIRQINISSFLSEKDIISHDKISELIKYSFINEEICKFFRIQNLSILPQVSLFVNINSNERYIYAYYNNQNSLFKVIN